MIWLLIPSLTSSVFIIPFNNCIPVILVFLPSLEHTMIGCQFRFYYTVPSSQGISPSQIFICLRCLIIQIPWPPSPFHSSIKRCHLLKVIFLFTVTKAINHCLVNLSIANILILYTYPELKLTVPLLFCLLIFFLLSQI